MIMLVAATIFIGGPTIIRGVNAHFKIWDDSVQDSYKDPLKQGPPISLPTNCVCDPPIGGPGLRCGAGICPETMHLETILCNPVGCGAALGIVEQSCVNDPTCCEIYQDTALCGTGGAVPDCPLGSRITRRACGGGTSQFGCRVDNDPTVIDGNPTCIPHCIGTYLAVENAANPRTAVICPGDDVAVVGNPWIQDASGIGLALRLIGTNLISCSHPPSPGPNLKCEAYCAFGYLPFGAGCTDGINYNIAWRIDGRNGNNVGTRANNQSFNRCFGANFTTMQIGGPGWPGCQAGNPSGSTPSAACVIFVFP